MAKSDKRVKITLECTECKERNCITMKSKINDRERLEMKKYCSRDRRFWRPMLYQLSYCPNRPPPTVR